MAKLIDLTGKKFGHLTTISFCGKTKSGASIWNCKCDCGNEKQVRGYHLIGKKIRSCGCLKRETANIKWMGYKEIPRYLWNSFRLNAEYRKIDFDLTAEDMWKQANEQKMKCALTDEPLVFVRRQQDRSKSNASLDRKDSTKGYVKENIQWVTKNVNIAKHCMTQDEFINVCEAVHSKFCKGR